MKMKKLAGAITALAMAGSMFAGFATVASAAEVVYSNDFETSSDFTAGGKTDGTTYNPDTTTANTKNSSVIGVGSAGGDANLQSPSFTDLETYDKDANYFHVSFDFKIDACTGGKSSNIALLGSKNKDSWLSSSQQILVINAPASGNGYFSALNVNGIDVKSSIVETGKYDIGTLNRNTTGWVTLDAVVDFESSSITYTMTKNNTTVVAKTTADFVDSGVTQLDRIFLAAGKGYGGVLLDNVLIEALEEPSFALSAQSIEVATGTTETVTVSDITGTVSVTSSDEDVATATYDNGVININGVSDGLATLTVTATNDGLTTTKTINVVVGGVEKANVTINYYVKGTTNAVPTLLSTIVEKAVNTVVTSDDITTDTVTTDTCKYVYDSTSVELPYAVVSGENIINVYYDAQALIETITVNYNCDGNTVYSEEKEISGFPGDTVTVGFKKYVLVDGVLYANAATGNNGYYRNNVVLENNINTMDIPVSVKSVDGTAVAVIEGSGTTNDYADIRASEGTAIRGTLELGTVTPGTYMIEGITYKRSGISKVMLDGEVISDFNMNTGSWGVATTTYVSVEKAGTLSVGVPSGVSGSDYLDCLLLVKTSDNLTDKWSFGEIELDNFIDANLYFKINDTNYHYGTLAEKFGITTSGAGTANFAIAVENDVEGEKVTGAWLVYDNDEE